MDNQLTLPDYEQLARIMTGPHGRAVTRDNPVTLLVVFSCADPEVGRAAARLHADGLVKRVVFSGGVGKDSGGLPALGVSEAVFLASVAIADGLPPELIVLEQEARNGMENAAFSLRLAHDQGFLSVTDRIASLAPAQRSRRLYEELRYQASLVDLPSVVYAGFSSGAADPHEPTVQAEFIRELRGLQTMHDQDVPRIFEQKEFQKDGAYYGLVKKAGIVVDISETGGLS
jgi:hypothetical protein